MSISFLAAVAIVFRLTLGAVLLAAGICLYRRLRLPSIPWLLAYFGLSFLLAWPMPLLAKHVIDQVSAGSTPFGVSLTAGELAVTMSFLAIVAATFAQAIVAWFIVAELSHAYSQSSPDVPPALLFPRRHSFASGMALLASAIVMPLAWLALATAGA